LLPLTRSIAGDDRPKQFCAIMNSDTLLNQTRSRVWRVVAAQRTVLVVTKTHERFYANQASIPSDSLLVQPCNRGTTPAILYSLLCLRKSDPAAVIGFFPSDHYFADDEGFIRDVNLGFEVAESSSGLVVLLGIKPDSPEVGYGWIEPAAQLLPNVSNSVFQVKRFWEKPSLPLASALMERGCLWNSFVMFGRVDSFLSLISRALPDLYESFESIRSAFLTETEGAALSNLYSRIRASNFSDEVLSAHPCDLAVLSSRNLGWSDLGEADRVLSVLARKGVNVRWALAPAEKWNAAS
jgi:mannose-1-phosphate guanylyltransferase